MDINSFESKTQRWSTPEGAFQIIETKSTHSHFITVESDETTMKIISTIYSGKDINKLKADNSFFQTRIGFFQLQSFDKNGTYGSEKIISFTTVDKIRLKCDCIDESVVNGL